MKTLLLFAFLFSTLFLSAQPKSSCADLEGVWQYDLPAERGMFFCSGNRYLWILIPKDRKPFAAEQPSQEEKAAAFDYLNISTGTLTCDGKRGTATHLYTKNPQESGQSIQFEYEKKDGKVKYWMILADGSRGPEGGNSHKIADFKPATQKGCHQMNGFWEYEIPDAYGISVISGGYFGWISIKKELIESKPDLNSLQGKAFGFDQITAAAGTATCDNNLRFTWTRLHAKDYRGEGTYFSSDSHFENDKLQWWFVDKDGKKTESGGKAKRLK